MNILSSSVTSTALSPPVLLVRQDLECVHKILARTQRRSMSPQHIRFAAVRAVLYNQDLVRVPPVVLAVARRTAPVALLLLRLPFPCCCRAPAKAIKCGLQADDSEDTRTTV